MQIISEKLWQEIMQESLKGAIRLLDTCQIILSNNGNKEVCAGLYTYALEEYGKYLMLKQYSPINQQVAINYGQIFRDTRHENKFKVAINDLKQQAVECTILAKGLFDPAIFDPKIFNTRPPVDVDFQARMRIFYCDLDDPKQSIRAIPKVDMVHLVKAIKRLRDIVLPLII
jgi:AbiV family abortive infection protein